MKNKKRYGWKKAAVTAGMGVFVAALTVPLVRVPAYAAYQPDYSYPPSGKGGVHVSDETAPGADATDAFGNVTGKQYGTDFYVAVWDVDPNDPATACKGWFRLVDQYGNPIPDVTFSLCRNDSTAQIHEPWNGKGTKTDADGYLLFYVPEGEYTVILQTPNGYETFQTKVYPMAKGENKHTVVLVKKSGGSSSGGGSGSGGGSSSGGTTIPETEGNKNPSPDVQPEPQPPENNGSQNPGGGGTTNPSGPAEEGQKPSTEKPEKPEDKREITLPGKDGIIGTEDDVTVRPDLDKDGNNNATIDKDGKVTLPDGGTVIFPSIPDQGKIGVEVPKGTVVLPNGIIKVPEGMAKEYVLPGKDAQLGTDDDVRVKPELGKSGTDRSYLREDGAVVLVDGGTVIYADGKSETVPPGTIVLPDGTILYPDAAETDAKPQGVHFGDCWFHWLELLAMLVMTLASLRRLLKIRKVHEELDEMEEKRDETEE